MKRKICYITGTRADFGLMANTLKHLHANPGVELTLCVTGTHLSQEYGYTIDEIKAFNFTIAREIEVALNPATSVTMAIAVANQMMGFTNAFHEIKPDIVLLLGDRGEMLAAALAAIHLNIPIAHIHGGERSGTIDESFRHAISKLSHYHFVATENSRDRLIKMGENPGAVFVTGAPGLDDISQRIAKSKSDICKELAIDVNASIGLAVFHPVVQEIEQMKYQIQEVISSMMEFSLEWICLLPNSDAGREYIHEALQAAKHRNIRLFTHMERALYLNCMSIADVMIGNSSSGIIEAASFGLGVVNIGSRQNLRERGNNVIDVLPHRDSITSAIHKIVTHGKYNECNIYGDGKAAELITHLLITLPLTNELISKSNAY